jgi:Fe-S-cluster containining protein
MPLSNADIERLERAGYDRKNFTYHDKNGFFRLKNHRGFCVFYDAEKRRCNIYRHRPSGCRVYPVIYSEQEEIVMTDDLCPMKNTISETELKRKGKKVMKLIQIIDKEAASRSSCFKSSLH